MVSILYMAHNLSLQILNHFSTFSLANSQVWKKILYFQIINFNRVRVDIIVVKIFFKVNVNKKKMLDYIFIFNYVDKKYSINTNIIHFLCWYKLKFKILKYLFSMKSYVYFYPLKFKFWICSWLNILLNNWTFLAVLFGKKRKIKLELDMKILFNKLFLIITFGNNPFL